MKRSTTVLITILTLAFMLSTAVFTPTGASGIVGTGTPQSCDEGALNAALAGGGSINFFCGNSPVVIAITQEKMITQNTTIDGGGKVIISGKNITRIFHVTSGVTLDLQKVTLAYGAANDPSDGSNRNGSGGGILNEGGTVKLTDSTITSSRADHNGGAIYNQNGAVTLVRTTISGNYVSDNGGGIINEKGTLTLGNVTLSGNFAGKNGGALFNFGGTVTMIHTTLSNNNAPFAGSGILDTQDGTVALKNTIIANNATNGSPVTGNCSGPVMDGGKNLQFPDNSCGPSIQMADPMLGTLADNGGYALTHALKAGSPAIDTADSGPCAADPINNVDERSVQRPIGAGCDIGAYEFDPKNPGSSADQPACGILIISSPATPQACLPPTKIPCPRGTNYDPKTGRCLPPPPQTCPTSLKYDPKLQKCVCPNGLLPDANGKCPNPPPPTCPPGLTLNTQNTCVCPSGLLPDANGRCPNPEKPTCPPGLILNRQNICVCPTFEPPNPDGTCGRRPNPTPTFTPTPHITIIIPLQPVCPVGQTYNPKTKQCDCPSGYEKIGNTCQEVPK